MSTNLWPEDEWKRARTGDHSIPVPSSRRPVKIPTSTLAIVAQSMEDETRDKLSPVAEGEPQRQPTGGYPRQHDVALPEPTVPEQNFQLVLEDLPYLPYNTTRQSAPSSALSEIYFRIRRPDGGASSGFGVPGNDAFPLWRAFAKDLDTLVDGNKSAPLGDASAKLSIRLLFPGCEPYDRQIMARRSTAGGEPISMRVLAHKIAEEMQKCLTNTSVADKPLMHRGRAVQLEDLYLWKLVRVSPGSWVPEFKVMTWLQH